MTTSDRNLLIESYLPYAEKLALKKAFQTGPRVSYEELKSAAYFGLVLAANNFNPEFNTTFSSYAFYRIIGEMRDYCRQLSWGKRGNYYSGKSIDNLDVGYFENFYSDLMTSILNCLNETDKLIFGLYYFDDMTLKEIAVKIALTEGRISQVLKKCRDKIRKRYDKEDLV